MYFVARNVSFLVAMCKRVYSTWIDISFFSFLLSFLLLHRVLFILIIKNGRVQFQSGMINRAKCFVFLIFRLYKQRPTLKNVAEKHASLADVCFIFETYCICFQFYFSVQLIFIVLTANKLANKLRLICFIWTIWTLFQLNSKSALNVNK